MQQPVDAAMPPSRLLALPAELRIAIFKLVLTPTARRSVVVYAVFFGLEANALARLPALTQTSRQLRAECMALYCSINSFKLGLTHDSDRVCVRKWLLQIDEHAKHIRHLQIWVEYLEIEMHRERVGGDWTLRHLRLRGATVPDAAIGPKTVPGLLEYMRAEQSKVWDRVMEVCGGELLPSGHA